MKMCEPQDHIPESLINVFKETFSLLEKSHCTQSPGEFVAAGQFASRRYGTPPGRKNTTMSLTRTEID